MAASQVQAKIALQMNRFNFIKSVALEVDSFSSLPLQTLRVKSGLIDSYWEKFDQLHEKLSDSKVESLLEHDYYKDGTYDRCLLYYADAKAALANEIEEKERSCPLSGSQLANLSIAGQTTARSHLPEITLPQFSGDFSAWRPFHDLFSSLVGRNPDISNVEKMHYLRTSLTGDAAQLISNLPLSEDSFASAWDLLVDRFENKRLLVSAQVDRLFNIRTSSTRSARDLNTLLNTATEALNALQALGSPIQHWDHLLVHLLVQRLDPHTREAWEVKLGSSTEPPSYKDLKTFITGRARALESMELGVSTTSPASSASKPRLRASPANALVATSPASGPDSAACALCSGQHYIVSCSYFRNMNPQHRRDIVIEKRLCFNCLGRHNAVACQNQKRCRECGNKHHTMIHTDTPRHTSTSVPETPTTATATATQTSVPPSPEKSDSPSSHE